MSELFIYIFIFVIVACFWLWELYECHKEMHILEKPSSSDKQFYNFRAIEENYIVMELIRDKNPKEKKCNLPLIHTGDELKLVPSTKESIPSFLVFSKGSYVGRLNVQDSELINCIMTQFKITGVYCRPTDESLPKKGSIEPNYTIIMFYVPREVRKFTPTINLYQN